MSASKLLLQSRESDLVPSPAEYAVLPPPGYSRDNEPIPLLLFLHGGGGDRSFLSERMRPMFDTLWDRDGLPPLVVATPTAARSFYLDYRDGSQQWEQFLTGQFLDEIRRRFNVKDEQTGTVIGGVSMGGLGSLRTALKHPDLFSAVVALEPAIDPAFAWSDVRARHTSYRPPQLFKSLFGPPFDPEYWAANNPATIARDNTVAIRESSLGIYFEVGDEDFLNLDEGTEFLHRILFDREIPHEYRLVRGGNHVGRTLGPRFLDAFAFLDRHLRPNIGAGRGTAGVSHRPWGSSGADRRKVAALAG